MECCERSRVGRYLLGLVLLAIFCGASCSERVNWVSAEAEAEFRDLFSAALTTDLAIVTDKQKYHHNGVIDFWVENRTEAVIRFEDQSFGVRAMTYDDASEQWLPVDLGFSVAEPIARSVESGGGGVLEHYSMLVDRIDVPDDGKIRLVIIGHTDLTNPAQDRIYVAYTDVQVVE